MIITFITIFQSKQVQVVDLEPDFFNVSSIYSPKWFIHQSHLLLLFKFELACSRLLIYSTLFNIYNAIICIIISDNFFSLNKSL